MLIDYSTTKLGTSRVARKWDDVCVKPEDVLYRKPIYFESMLTDVRPGDFLVVRKGEDDNSCDVVVGVLQIVRKTIIGNVFATKGSLYGGGRRGAGYLHTKSGKFEEVFWTKEICTFHGEHHPWNVMKAKVHMEKDLQNVKYKVGLDGCMKHCACRFRYKDERNVFAFETEWHPW